jgi:multicomponent Na+:H+ antiporter subunit F
LIALIAAAAAGFALLLGLVRLFAGPTLHDRALAAKTVMIRAALVCAALAVAAGRQDWIDVAIALVLGALIIMVAVVKVFRARSFQSALAREEA